MPRWHVAIVKRMLSLVGLGMHRLPTFGVDPNADVRRVLGGNPRTVLDVGANVGQAAQRFLREFPGAAVYSFEPLPAAVNALRELAKKHSELTVVPCALGDQGEIAGLHVTASSDGSSLLELAVAPGSLGEWTYPVDQVDVEVRRLDAVCVELGIANVDLLKVDTQGFDLRVLRGAGEMLAPSRIRCVLIEISFDTFYTDQSAPHEVMAFLAQAGYRPVAMYPGLRAPSGQLSWVDMLFA